MRILLVEDNQALAADAGIDLGFEGEGQVFVALEPLLTGELLRNLIGNALLYAGKGAEVTVRVAQTAARAVLEVEDDGPGIPPERRAAVLKRFERGDRIDASGTGLGLPIVEEIARLHGAHLSLVEGRGGRGSRPSYGFHWPDKCLASLSLHLIPETSTRMRSIICPYS